MAQDTFRTEYLVQPFVAQRRTLAARPLRLAASVESATRLGERLARSHAGVLVLSRRVAPELGEYEEPRIVARFGQVPADHIEELIAA